MPDNFNKLSHFWQELKRRRVVHVITVYASAAFVIIELINNLAEPLNLPPNLLSLVVIVLAVGFPLAIILSWLYDLTTEGVIKTKPIEELKEKEKTVVPNAWKIATYVSFIVIVGLAVLNIFDRNKQLRAGDIQTLLILPFENLTGDDQLDNVIAGMHSSLIGDIGRINGLIVFSKTTSDYYKDAGMTLSQIAEELGADAIVEPAVRCYGERICFDLKMIDSEEKQLWISEYDEPKSQILNLQNRVTKQIADEVKIELTADKEAILAETRTVDDEAYDAYLMGYFFWEKLDPESMQKAMEYFQLAIDLDPEWADPYAGLANAWGILGVFGFLPKSATLPNTYKFLNRALELDPNSAQTQFVKAINSVWQEWNWDLGEKAFLKSIELNPNDALTRLYYAHLLLILHRSDEAAHQASVGLELAPLKPLVLSLYGMILSFEGEYESAILYFNKALSIDPNFFIATGNLSGAQWNLAYETGDYEKWFEKWDEKVKGGWKDEGRVAVMNTFYEKGHIAGIEEMFKMNEKYGDEGCLMDDEIKARRYIKLGDYDKAMDFVEKVFEMRNVNTAYYANNYYYAHLKDHPRYIALLRKMNLPFLED